jgi:hypothetical protein
LRAAKRRSNRFSEQRLLHSVRNEAFYFLYIYAYDISHITSNPHIPQPDHLIQLPILQQSISQLSIDTLVQQETFDA